jgi:glycosyltransferase involved in cell wall biosynthesis
VAKQLDPDSLTLFVTREVRDLGDLKCEKVVAPVPTPHEIFRAAWEHTFVPLSARRHGLNVFHSPNYTLPFTLPCPSVVTVHDLAFMDRRFHKTRLRLYLTLLTKLSLRRADHVIAVSEYTKRQVEAYFPFLKGRVSVVYSGLDPSFVGTPSTNGNGTSGGRSKPYILFVGSIEPRKNLPRLIRAFERAMSDTDLPHELVLCGPLGWRYGAVEEAFRRSPLRERIRRTGYVPSADLPSLYAGADLLAYPSLDEGFGFPVLEAMASGTPVVTSDRSSLPEVAGGAAVTVSPSDEGAIADAISTVLTDRDLANNLAERGRVRASEFTWDRAASQTIDIYRRVAK